ncbi:hypothetical protein EVAR_14706_1 [Eumeta japonica]|uniref:Uncharacterized protein n=1 Tax=Eumeta variegata TaxID=151549 RepID=A0A4C1U2T4_EUMVA|nr:hypothetical protein EVAR_14706_1 [Eumeta japonica]
MKRLGGRLRAPRRDRPERGVPSPRRRSALSRPMKTFHFYDSQRRGRHRNRTRQRVPLNKATRNEKMIITLVCPLCFVAFRDVIVRETRRLPLVAAAPADWPLVFPSHAPFVSNCKAKSTHNDIPDKIQKTKVTLQRYFSARDFMVCDLTTAVQRVKGEGLVHHRYPTDKMRRLE